MKTGFETIGTRQLKQLRESDEDFLLINVLDKKYFDDMHIPGSKNIPVSKDDFVKQVEKLAGSKDRKIVVYCANEECDASPKAAQKLDEAGFENVLDFEGGTKAWQEAGHKVEGKSCPTC